MANVDVQFELPGLLITAGLTSEDVLNAVESLMAFRLRAGGFAAGRGGTRVEHFTDTTTPTRARAVEVTQRKAEQVVREYPSADPEDAAQLVQVAALRAAIELESSSENFDADRVKTWRDMLRDEVGLLNERLGEPGSNPDEGARGMDARWDFGPRRHAHVEGAEEPLVTSRRRRW